MHGRLKIKSTAEQQEAKQKEREVKLKAFQAATKKIVLKRDDKEHDDEALYLTKEILLNNPDYYTMWNYRREIFLHLKLEKSDEELMKLCSDELFLTQSCLMNNPKSYASWHHRGWIMNFMPQPDWKNELKLCKNFLSIDERNFHCYDYRRFIGNNCDLKASEELSFTSDLIAKNFSNYSAWHYRSTLLPIVHPGSGHRSVDEAVLLKEYELVQNAAFTDPYDQSAWFYHRWLQGRGELPLEVVMLYVSRSSPSVVVLLSKPIKLNEKCLQLLIDGKSIETTWETAGDNLYASALWLCAKVPDVLIGDGTMEVTLELQNSEKKSTLSCLLEKFEVVNWRNSYKTSVFKSELSAAAKDVLEKELESCQLLWEYESDNKWTLITSALLMQVLDSKKYQETIFSYFDKLLEIDSLRSNYYKDLRSKLMIENKIENLPANIMEVSLSSCSLTSLHHLEHFSLIKKLDLSFNNINSTDMFGLLVCVEVLVLDGNKVKNCRGIKDLLRLKNLSLKQNDISMVENLAPLATCPMLEILCIEDNPVTSDTQYKSKLKNILKLKMLHGELL